MSSPPDASRRFHSLWRMRSYCRPYLGQMILMALAASASIGAGIVVPLVTEAVINGPIDHHRSADLVLLGVLAILFGMAEALGTFVRRWVQSFGILAIETNARNDLYEHLQALPIAFHDAWQSGQLLSRATADISTIRRFLGFGLIYLLVNSATFVIVTILLIHLDPLLGLIVAVSSLPVIWLANAFERRYRVVSRAVQDQQGDLTTVIEEGAQGIRVLKSFGRRREYLAKFMVEAETLYRTSMRRVRLEATFFSFLQLVPNLTLPLVLVVGGLGVAHHTLSLGALVAFMSLLLIMTWPVESLGFILASAQEAATAADRLFEVFDTVPSVAEPKRPRRIASPRGRLSFEEVEFAYSASGDRVLSSCNLVVEPGETVAIVGTTGSGKSTLLSLVPRLRDVTGGAVRIDGVDVRELAIADLRRLVGVAFEEPILFSASVRENVLLGVPDASEDDLYEALEVAQASFVFELPWGLETRVGEQGLTLSGGQRQRLALARAIVARPRLLILDDPLSALDVHTEAEVESALSRILVGTTALIVAHRPSTVALADRAALLERGSIVATGTHSALMASSSSYRAVLSEEAGPGREVAPLGVEEAS